MNLYQSAGECVFLVVRTTTAVPLDDLTVSFGFTPRAEPAPGSTWHAAEWNPSTRTARLLVGAGAVALPTGATSVWVKATNAVETVIDELGHIGVI
ncbi:hypothetical protein JOD54_000840 [Actinokineospora baliensis]|uniref:hypothetical protein n=1 Tax=Actinokineospora baliensis TaxID=547056 RepID=UPI0019590D2D|nr:hypothetical protein [Actinokineospora baliensis]MBM7770636.1 hypothetical protein [Actinokineospora baliensis]